MDFEKQKIPEKRPDRPFTFAVLSDTHITAKPPRSALFAGALRYLEEWHFWNHAERLQSLAREVAACGPDFVFITGDLVQHPTQKEINIFKSFARALGSPVYPLMGNHDWDSFDLRAMPALLGMRSMRQADGNFTKKWQGVFPDNEFHYSFERGPFKFMAVDNGRMTVDAAQVAWLDAELENAPAGRTFLFAHVPISSPRTREAVRKYWGSIRNTPVAPLVRLSPGRGGRMSGLLVSEDEPLANVIRRHRKKVAKMFAGHLHVCVEDDAAGVRQVVSPLAAGSAGSFALWRCDPGSGSYERIKDYE